MRKYLLIVFFSANYFFGNAQFQQYFGNLDTLQTQLNISSENYFQSNFITGKIASDIVFSKFITEETKNSLLNRKGPYNHALFEAKQQFGIQYRLKKNIALGLTLEDRILGYGSFFDELVVLAVFGNRNFGEKTFRLKDSYFNLVRFQTLLPTFSYQLKNNHQLKVGVGFINGQRLIQANTSNSNMYVSEFGDYIEMNVYGSFTTSDTSNTGFLTNNGNGINIQLSYQIPFSFLEDEYLKGKLEFFVKDLGFVSFNDKSLSFIQENEFYNYEGVQIPNLTNYPARIFQEQSPDTLLDDLLAQNSLVKPTFNLPFSVGVSHVQALSTKSVINYGVVYRNMTNYRPMAFCYYQNQLNQWLALSGNFHFLGMGNFAIGGGLDLSWNSLTFSMNTANLNGLIFKQSQTGLGVFANLKYNL